MGSTTRTGLSQTGPSCCFPFAGSAGNAERSDACVMVEDDDHLDFSGLNVTKHGGVLLDGVGDAMVLKKHREALQGRPKALKGGRSQTMRYSYPFTLARRPVVVTMDLSVANLDLLESDHWLRDPQNITVLRLTAPAWV